MLAAERKRRKNKDGGEQGPGEEGGGIEEGWVNLESSKKTMAKGKGGLEALRFLGVNAKQLYACEDQGGVVKGLEAGTYYIGWSRSLKISRFLGLNAK